MIIATAAALIVLAQSVQDRTGIPDGGIRGVMVSIFIPPLPDRPFTGTLNTEWVRVLGDGSRITLKNHRLIARDASGRIFQERRLLVPESGGPESVLTHLDIIDPVAHDHYICLAQQRTCQVEVFQPLGPQPAPKTSDTREESLGIHMIAGLEAIGTRQTTIIPQGRIGNSAPLVMKMEYWFSRQLSFNALSILEDPQSGTQRFELSGVKLGEPDPALFVLPADWKLHDLRGRAALTLDNTAAK